MDIQEAREFLADHHRAVMATYRADGEVQLSPVLAGVDGEGRAVVSTRETAMKAKNLERNPRTSLCVLDDGFFGRWVRIDGRAEILRGEEAVEPLVDYYRRVQGEHSDWEEYREAMRRDRRVLVRIHITDAGPDVSG